MYFRRGSTWAIGVAALIVVAFAPQRARAVDSRLVGTWQGTTTNTQGTWGLTFTVEGDGGYRTRISGPGNLPDEIGTLQADKGRYSLRNQLGKTDSGSYRFNGSDAVTFQGQSGIPLTFRRVTLERSAHSPDRPRLQSGEDLASVLEPALLHPVPGAFDAAADAIYQRGLAAFRARDFRRALPDIKEAARRGSPKAQNVLGQMYEDGDGMPKNLQLARANYELSAKQGYRAAQSALGAMYEDGTGVPQNSAKAAALYRLAADQKLGVAEAELGLLYEFGEGVPRDRRKAIYWLELAGSQGDGRAQWIAEWLRNPATPHFQSDIQMGNYIDSQVAKYYASQLPQGNGGGNSPPTSAYQCQDNSVELRWSATCGALKRGER